ncbi:MAG TPA: cysteine--tRNA ligase [Marmoricola sp.]|nr:cysteine--tRNA ligase [Marmoricola sp.]
MPANAPDTDFVDGPGVVGSSGRYPVAAAPAAALGIAGRRFVPVGPVRMYACGITPYDVTHVGHAATFVWADLVASLARAVGSEAVVCRNVTDIDDVLTRAAAERGRAYDEFALTQEFSFDRDMRALAVAEPALKPHARSHVRAAQRLAAALLDAGAAYATDGFVYFRGAHLPSRHGLSEERALELSEEYGDQHDVPGRESPFDVPVWRPSPDDHPAWPSPWGWGRPGWHAECAAMALSSFGASVDVLLGGADLAFPHHAYQAAMAEAATGVVPFAGSVVHVGEVRRDGVKMAKSTGNLVLVSDLLQRFPGPAVRLALLNRRFDEPWECTDEVFANGAALLDELNAVAGGSTGTSADQAARHEVVHLLADGLDVPSAVSHALAAGPSAARLLLAVLRLR